MILDLVWGAGYRQPDMLADRPGERVVQEDQEGLSSLCDLALRDIQCRAVSQERSSCESWRFVLLNSFRIFSSWQLWTVWNILIKLLDHQSGPALVNWIQPAVLILLWLISFYFKNLPTHLVQPEGVVLRHVLLLSPRDGVVVLHEAHGTVQGELALGSLPAGGRKCLKYFQSVQVNISDPWLCCLLG